MPRGVTLHPRARDTKNEDGIYLSKTREYKTESMKRWRLANLDKSRKNAADNHARRKEQEATRPRPDLCEVCNRTNWRRMNFDHDHKTGLFRGWLCDQCNKALGNAEDSPETLDKLASYLRLAA